MISATGAGFEASVASAESTEELQPERTTTSAREQTARRIAVMSFFIKSTFFF